MPIYEEDTPFRWFYEFMLVDTLAFTRLEELRDGNLLMFMTIVDRKLNGRATEQD